MKVRGSKFVFWLARVFILEETRINKYFNQNILNADRSIIIDTSPS